MRKAIKELEEEDEERRREYEDYMRKMEEKEDDRERARQEREESADKDVLGDFEGKELERRRAVGEDPEDVLRQWREQYVKEVKDRLGETPESEEQEEEQEDVGTGPEQPADSLSYFGDGTGQMYATKSEPREKTSGELGSESEKDAQSKELDEEQEPAKPSETNARPEKHERTTPDADEDLESETEKSPEKSGQRESEESPVQRRASREIVAEGEVEKKMDDESEPESGEKDQKKEFYNRPEEEWRRKYRESFEEREEEEKEEFREVLVDQVKEKEDVEDEDAMEEIEEYLQTRKALENADEEEKEELAEEMGVDPKLLKEGDLSEILPESLKELLNREGDLLWRELDRRYIESFFPESIEELESVEGIQSLDGHQKEEAEAWIEIMAMRREYEIDSIVSDGQEWYDREQIEELSQKYGLDEDEILKWLRLERIPPLIEQIGYDSIHEYLQAESEVEEVRRLYFNDGLSMKRVAERLGFGSVKTVQRIFQEQDWKARPPGVQRKEFDLAEMRTLYYEKGFTLKELSQQVGIDRHTMGKVFKEQGWKTRRASAIERSATILKQSSTSARESKSLTVKPRPALEKAKKKEVSPRKSAPRKKIVDLEKLSRMYYVEGKSLNVISKILGISTATLSKRFKEQGWRTRQEEVSEAARDIDTIRKLYFDDGMPMREVAERIGSSEGVIRRVFRDQGWTSRKRTFDSEEERTQARIEHASKTAQKIKDRREKLFGTKCYLCGEKRMLAIHRKDGTEHNRHLLWRLRFLETLNPNEWVPLGVPCHRGVHWLIDSHAFDWEKIASLAKDARHSKSKTKERLKLPSEDTPSSSRYLELKEKYGTDIDSLRREFFGDSCVLCGARNKKYMPIHRKDGRKHSSRLTISEKYLRTLDPDDWVRLCNKHHRHVHWAMEKLGLEWKDLKPEKDMDSS
jgi:AraC-like DNA-binding protein